MTTVPRLAREGVAPSASKICTTVALPFTVMPPVLALTRQGSTVILSPTCGPCPGGKVLFVTTNVHDPNSVGPEKLAGCPSVPVMLGAVIVAVGVAEVVSVNVTAIG